MVGARIAIVLVAVILACAGAARAAESALAGGRVLLRADTLTYDRNLGIVTAAGSVEIAQGERILLADRVSYDLNTDTVTASGNVSLLEPSGDVVFADFVELRDDLREGLIRDIRVLLSDGSRMAANGAFRMEGNRTELIKAVFSPCNLCPDHPERAPLWQIKAVRVIHDQARQDIEYKDAFLEVFGVPVAYTPYFAHPDPTVTRRSGFLAPEYGGRGDLGLTLQVPYYFNLAPNRDATFAPIFTSKEGVVLAGEYRERTESGRFEFSGSITRPRRRGDNGERIGGRDTRGHIEGFGRFDLDRRWRWGFDLARSTDDTYMRRYGFGFADTLTSSAFIDRTEGRNYSALTAYSFQGLDETDDPGLTPLVLPFGEDEHIFEGVWGGRARLNSNLMWLTRTEGVDSRRVSVTGAWEKPWLGPFGDVTTLTTSLRGDLYVVDDAIDPAVPNRPTDTDVTGRVVPLVSLDWRYPWMRGAGRVRQTIEPMVKLVWSPNGGNPEEIPNEDSQDFEFDDTNLFSTHRFPGLDRVEGGFRVSYGLRAGVYGAGGGRTTVFLGQSWRARADSTFEPGSGLEKHTSDIVGRLDVVPGPYLDLSYRFRLDREDLTSRRSEVALAAGPAWLRLNLNFLSLDDDAADLDGVVGRREEITASLRAELTDYWAVRVHNRRDLTNDDTINTGAAITYQDECLEVRAELERRFTRDRDVDPDTAFKLVIRLKHLG